MSRSFVLALFFVVLAAGCQCAPAVSLDCDTCSAPDASVTADSGEDAGTELPDSGFDAGEDGGSALSDAGTDGGTDAGATSCDPAACRGCCNGTTCLDFGSQSNQLCGNSNEACFACGNGLKCEGGACIRDVAQACLLFAPDELDFRNVAVGCAVERDVRIYSRCSLPMTLDGFDFPPDSPYSVVAAPSFPAGVSASPFTVRIRFQPSDAGAFTQGATVALTAAGASRTEPYWVHGTGDDAGVSTDEFEVRGAADVILVLDRTTQMAPKVDFVRDHPADMLSWPLANQTSFHFAVLSGHFAMQQDFPVIGYFLRSDAGSYMTEFSPLAEYRALVPDGGGEPATGLNFIAPPFAAVTPPTSTSANAGFMRRNASLAVLMMTNTAGLTVPSMLIDVLRSAKGYQNANDVIISTVGPVNSSAAPGCTYRTGPDDGGYRYLAEETGGIVVDVCSFSAQQLRDLSRNVFGGEQHDFRVLGTANGIPTVSVNGSAVPSTFGGATVWTWDGGTVAFRPNYYPVGGDRVRIEYPSACLP